MAAKARLIISYVALAFLAGHVWTKGKPPRLIIKPRREYNVRVGIKVKIKCVASGIKDPPENRTLIAWKKLGHGFVNRHERNYSRYRFSKRGLRIVNVQPRDGGQYMCIAANINGKVNATTTVNVRGKPTIPEYPFTNKVSSDIPRSPEIDSTSPSKPRRGRPPRFIGRSSSHQTNINQVSGRSVKLKCKASGRPTPKITWHKNNRRLSPSKRRQHLTGKGWILAFDHLLMNDAGKYICRVRNKFGTISRIFNLRVAPNENPQQVRKDGIQIALHNITAYEGDNATFVCKVIGAYRPAHVSWLKFNWNFSAPASQNSHPDDHQLITQANHTLRQKLLTDKPVTLPGTKKRSFSNRLVLLHVKKEDEGMYTCTVGNIAGFQSTQAYLTVKRKPEAINFNSRGDKLEIRGEIPMAAFIGVPLAVATVLIASLVWCFAQTRKSKGKSSSQSAVATLDTKLSLEMRSVTHERPNDYSSPATEQSRMCSDEQSRMCSDEKSRTCSDEQLRMCSEDAAMDRNNRVSCECDKPNISEEHSSSLHFNHRESNSCDAHTQEENSQKQSTESDSHNEGDDIRTLHHNLHIYELPNLQKIRNGTSIELESNLTDRSPPCFCKSNSYFCNSSITNSETLQSVV